MKRKDCLSWYSCPAYITVGTQWFRGIPCFHLYAMAPAIERDSMAVQLSVQATEALQLLHDHGAAAEQPLAMQ